MGVGGTGDGTVLSELVFTWLTGLKNVCIRPSGNLVWERLGLAPGPCQRHWAKPRSPSAGELQGEWPFPWGCESIPAMGPSSARGSVGST